MNQVDEAGKAPAGDWACSRCGAPGPRLEFAPWPGEIGAELQSKICDNCWNEWVGMQTKMINEYRLNVLHPEHRQAVREQMAVFLGLAEGTEGA